MEPQKRPNAWKTRYLSFGWDIHLIKLSRVDVDEKGRICFGKGDLMCFCHKIGDFLYKSNLTLCSEPKTSWEWTSDDHRWWTDDEQTLNCLRYIAITAAASVLFVHEVVPLLCRCAPLPQSPHRWFSDFGEFEWVEFSFIFCEEFFNQKRYQQ